MYLLENEQRICSKTNLEDYKRNFAYIREIKDDINKHPIEHLMEESDIPCGPIVIEKRKKILNKTAVLTNGYFPTRSLNSKQINNIIKNISNEFVINPTNKWYDDFDCVIGVENEQLYQAAALGIDTILVPTGNGENLFLKMFPNNQIKYFNE